jgi:LPXTG-motif cell wall-anchored protein
VAGSAVIRDSSAGLSDQVSVTMTDVPALGASQVYEGWLISDDGSTSLSIGILSVDSDGIIDTSDDPYTNADGANLAAGYDQFVITIEPVPDDDAASSGNIAFSDQIPADGMAHIRHLLSAAPGTTTGITVGLWGQTNAALTSASSAADSTTLADIQQHAAHVINIIEGSDGANFVADEDNPGDGVGVLSYASDARTHAELVVSAVPGDATFSLYEPNVSESADNVADWAGQARDFAVLARSQSSVSVATAFIANAESLLERALNGYDADRDGSIVAGGSEGGAAQAQTSAQDLATYNPREGASLPATGDVNWTTFAVMAIAAGAVLLTIGGLLVRRSRTHLA